MDDDSRNHDLVTARLAVIGRLTGHVVHDVNNALSPLVGKLQILRMQELSDPGKIAGDLEIMEHDSISASRRLQVLSQLSREAPVVEPPKPLVISDCVREMEFLVGHHLERRGIEVELAMESTMRAASATGIDTKLIIGGLMIAVLSAAPSGGVLRIGSSDVDHDHVSLLFTVEGRESPLDISHELADLIRSVSSFASVSIPAETPDRVTVRFGIA